MLHNKNNRATFKHFDLELIDPEFGSKLTDLIIELDYLRKKRLTGSTHPSVFFQLKHIFHMLESIGSARIEGNHTTIAEYIETKFVKEKSKDENILEILNSEEAIEFIEANVIESDINRTFISELHKIVVNNLVREGSKNPGEFRNSNLIIQESKHNPPDFTRVLDYMEELFLFINNETSEKYDLLKTAIAHHRFAWIHPFDNGNGRTVRLLTYAMLVKQGFNSNLLSDIFPYDHPKYIEIDTKVEKTLTEYKELFKNIKYKNMNDDYSFILLEEQNKTNYLLGLLHKFKKRLLNL